MKLITFLALAFTCCHVSAEERYLLAADNQVIEINRAGKVGVARCSQRHRHPDRRAR